MLDHKDSTKFYGTTILAVRKNGKVAIAGDGQVSLGSTVLKSNAKKINAKCFCDLIYHLPFWHLAFLYHEC